MKDIFTLVAFKGRVKICEMWPVTQCSWEHNGKSQQPGLCLGVTLRKPSLKRRSKFEKETVPSQFRVGFCKGASPPSCSKFRYLTYTNGCNGLMLSFVTFFRFHFCHLCGFKVTQGQLRPHRQEKIIFAPLFQLYSTDFRF